MMRQVLIKSVESRGVEERGRRKGDSKLKVKGIISNIRMIGLWCRDWRGNHIGSNNNITIGKSNFNIY